MQTINKIFSLDKLIFILLFGLLPIDMLNGYLLREVAAQPLISIAQIYKMIVLVLLIIRVNDLERFILLCIFGILILPTIVHSSIAADIKLLLKDSVKILKYLGSVVAFFYFRSILIKQDDFLSWIHKWILFSFVFLVFNIFLKVFGFGFPMYVMNTIEIGSKGFFYAGNEVSGVLIILSSFLMFWYQLHNNKRLFFIIAVVSILTGLYITSKTAILGTIIGFIYFYIFNPSRALFSVRTFLKFSLVVFVLIPVGGYLVFNILDSLGIIARFQYFWKELDVYTFILSNRNTFLFDFIEIFKKEYNVLEMFFGVGQGTFEALNNNHIIELDFFDIYFAYGVIGVILFITYVGYIFIKSTMYITQWKIFVFAPFTRYIVVFLSILSFLSGHIFNSGMAAIYMGCVFALMYYKKKHERKSI